METNRYQLEYSIDLKEVKTTLIARKQRTIYLRIYREPPLYCYCTAIKPRFNLMGEESGN